MGHIKNKTCVIPQRNIKRKLQWCGRKNEGSHFVNATIERGRKVLLGRCPK